MFNKRDVTENISKLRDIRESYKYKRYPAVTRKPKDFIILLDNLSGVFVNNFLREFWDIVSLYDRCREH